MIWCTFRPAPSAPAMQICRKVNSDRIEVNVDASGTHSSSDLLIWAPRDQWTRMPTVARITQRAMPRSKHRQIPPSHFSQGGFDACFALWRNILIRFTISVRAILDYARNSIGPLNTYYALDTLMADAEQEWAMNHYSYMQCHHPDKVQAFSEVRNRLGTSQNKEWWSYLHALECSNDDRCNEADCPMCQVTQEEAAALRKP